MAEIEAAESGGIYVDDGEDEEDEGDEDGGDGLGDEPDMDRPAGPARDPGRGPDARDEAAAARRRGRCGGGAARESESARPAAQRPVRAASPCLVPPLLHRGDACNRGTCAQPARASSPSAQARPAALARAPLCAHTPKGSAPLVS